MGCDKLKLNIDSVEVDLEKLRKYIYKLAANEGFDFYNSFESKYKDIMIEYKANAMLESYLQTKKQYSEVDCKGNKKKCMLDEAGYIVCYADTDSVYVKGCF